MSGKVSNCPTGSLYVGRFYHKVIEYDFAQKGNLQMRMICISVSYQGGALHNPPDGAGVEGKYSLQGNSTKSIAQFQKYP